MDSHQQEMPDLSVQTGSLSVMEADGGEVKAQKYDPYLAWRFPNFRLLFLGAFLATMGEQMQAVAIGWELYDRTGSALILGGVGLVLVLPVIVFSLPGGQLADRADRKLIVMITQGVIALSSLGL